MFWQVVVSNDRETLSVYENCGGTSCMGKILKAVGVTDGGSDSGPFLVGKGLTVEVMSHEEKDGCTWCFGCGAFLEHGLSCDCRERGYDSGVDRDPMRPMVDVTGDLALRPFWVGLTFHSYETH
jgi:hypothetical protein